MVIFSLYRLFLIFKVYLFVNDLVSIIRFGKKEEGYDNYKFIDGFEGRKNRLAVLGHSFTTFYLLHLYFNVVMSLVNGAHSCFSPFTSHFCLSPFM